MKIIERYKEKKRKIIKMKIRLMTIYHLCYEAHNDINKLIDIQNYVLRNCKEYEK